MTSEYTCILFCCILSGPDDTFSSLEMVVLTYYAQEVDYIANTWCIIFEETIPLSLGLSDYEPSSVATGWQGGRVPPLTAKNLPKIGKKEDKSGRKGKDRDR